MTYLAVTSAGRHARVQFAPHTSGSYVSPLRVRGLEATTPAPVAPPSGPGLMLASKPEPRTASPRLRGQAGE